MALHVKGYIIVGASTKLCGISIAMAHVSPNQIKSAKCRSHTIARLFVPLRPDFGSTSIVWWIVRRLGANILSLNIRWSSQRRPLHSSGNMRIDGPLRGHSSLKNNRWMIDNHAMEINGKCGTLPSNTGLCCLLWRWARGWWRRQP